jgi:UDP:flavonoid glycosyltransferase YjiC (YdhE family)
MLLLPITFDGPGNTARAVYHGLALKADFRMVTAEDFKTALEELLDVPSYSDAAKRMSREFIELENQAPSIAIIEKALARKLNFSPICTRSSAV